MTTDTPWHDHAWAKARLGVCGRVLRRLMLAAEGSTIEPAWRNVGTAKSPLYRWRGDRFDAWVEEVTAWQASQSAEASGSSAGATPTEASGDGVSTRRGRRKRTPSRSPTAAPEVSGGSLAMHALRLCSSSSRETG